MKETYNFLVLSGSPASGTKLKRLIDKFYSDNPVKTVRTKHTYYKKLNTQRVDVIILDLNTKSIDIIELLEHKKRHFQAIPLLIIAETEQEDLALKCMDHEADDYIFKSDLQRIKYSLNNLIKRNQIESELNRIKNTVEETRKKFESIQKKHNDIIQNMFECFFVADNDGVLRDYNSEFVKVLGLDTKKDYRGFKLENFWQVKDERKRYVEALLKNGYVKEYPAKGYRLDGEEVVLRINARLLKDDNNKPKGIVGTLLDITEKTKTQKKLLFNESLLDALLNNFPENIYFKDKESRFIKTSLHMAKIFGGNSSDYLKQKTDFDIFDKNQAKLRFNDEQKIINTGKPLINLTEHVSYDSDKLKYVSTTKLPLYDQNNSIIGTFGISRDITKQVFAQEELQRSSRELQRKNKLIQNLNKELEKKIIERTQEITAQKAELEESNILLEKSRKAALSIMQDAEIQKEKAEQAYKFLELNTAELKKLSRAIENSPVTVVITNKNGIIEYANPNNFRISGYPIEEIIGKKTNLFKSGYHDQVFYQNIWETILSGNVWTGELLNKKKNGSYYWENTSISPITNDEGNITHFVAVKEDITEKKKTEYEIQYLLRFQSLLTRISSTFINLGIDAVDSQIDKALKEIVTFMNADTAYVYIFSEDGEYISLKHFWSTVNSLLDKEPFQNIETDPESKLIRSLLKGSIISYSDIDDHPEEKHHMQRMFLSQGVKSVVAVPMVFNGKTIGCLGLNKIKIPRNWKNEEKNLLKLVGTIFTNAIKRKQSQLELINEKKFTETVMQSMPGIFFAFTEEGKFMRWNENFEKFTGYNTKKISSMDPFERIYKEDLQKTIEALYQTLQTGYSQVETRLVNSKREIIPHIITAATAQLAETNYIIGSAFDISDRLAMEEELKKSKEIAESATEAKSNFLAVMSHEIRTPMNAIIGFSNLMSKTNLDNKQQDYVRKIDNSAYGLLGIIDDILDFSKIEAGKLEIESIAFELNDVLHILADIISVKAQEKNLEVIFKTNKDVPLHLIGDPFRLRQVLLNLASNAIKFTEKGEVVIYTELLYEEENNAIIKFSVMDTGVGISSDKIAELFQPFRQGESSVSRRFGGTGLGLSISRHLVNLMGGDIRVESRPKKGSSFSFTIFVRVNEDEKRNFDLSLKDLKDLNILVVDDNKTARDVIIGHLNYFSFTSLASSSAEKAITELTKSIQTDNPEFDLIIMDSDMPEMDGKEAAQQLKTHPQFKSIPIILMLNSLDRKEIINENMTENINGLLFKPVTASSLLDAILDVFGFETDREAHNKSENYLASKIAKIRGAHFLLVEDNEINQQVAFELLQSEGFKVTIADNGKEALNKIKNKQNNLFDLVLMDVQMPVMDGFEATESIRKKYNLDELPVIAMTADAVVGVREKCLEAGMNDYITKPINPDDLFNKLVKWLKPLKRDTNILDTQQNEKPESNLEIEYLNTKKGIERLKGNSKAYQNIILKFKNNHQNVVSTINKHLNKNELEKARLMVHSLKGVSGNISADRLHISCFNLEQALKKENNKEITKAFKHFENEMNNVLKSIAGYEKRADKKSVPAKKNAAENKDYIGSAITALKDIEKLLNENNMRARTALELLADENSSTSIQELVLQLLKYLDDYDFNSAYNFLHDFLKKQNNNI